VGVSGVDPAAGLPRPLRLGVLASGAGSNLQALLDALADGRRGVVPAVVASDRPDAGALARAAAAGVPTEVVRPRAYPDRAAFEAALVEALRRHDVHVVALAGFMRLLGAAFLDAFPLRVLNVHPALCPAFPGLHAPAQALAWGVKLAGCTVHFVDTGVDTGPIIAQAAVPVADDDDEDSLHARIRREEHRLLPEAFALLAAGRLRVEGRRVRVLNA
jgi:phosphoribosylglycinamide formyltransferase-1